MNILNALDLTKLVVVKYPADLLRQGRTCPITGGLGFSHLPRGKHVSTNGTLEITGDEDGMWVSFGAVTRPQDSCPSITIGYYDRLMQKNPGDEYTIGTWYIIPDATVAYLAERQYRTQP